MWDASLTYLLIAVGVLALLLLIDFRTTGYVRRFFQAQPSRPPKLIDLAADSSDTTEDNRPTWLLLTRSMPTWTADEVAEICAQVWQVPVNQHEHDVNFVIGEAPCLMLRHGDWHFLLTIGDEPYMDPEHTPETDNTVIRQLFAAHLSWISLSVVGTPDYETPRGATALKRSAMLVAELSGDVGLVLIGPPPQGAWRWTLELKAQLRQGSLIALYKSITTDN